MTFKSVEELKRHVLPKLRNTIHKVEQEVYHTINKCLYQYYNEFEPEEYIRTKKLLHSLVKTAIKSTKNGYEAEVYFDESQLVYEKEHVLRKSGWYGSATWGADEVLDTSMNGSHGGHVDGIAIWGTSKAILGDICAKIVKELKAQGIPIK